MDLFESGAFGRNTPAWHGKGNVHVETFVFEDIFPEDGSLGVAGINWDVEKRKLYVPSSAGSMVEVPGLRGITRKLDDAPLGVVGSGYSPIQNRDIFRFVKEAMSDKVLRWDTAVSLDGGRTVAGVLLCTDSGVELVKGDRHFLFLAVVTTHDGSGSAKVFPTDVRIVCANTARAALNSRDRTLTVNVRHSGAVETKLDAAQDILHRADAQYRRMLEWQRSLTDIHATNKQVAAVCESLFPTQKDETPRSKTIRENKVLALQSAIRTEMKLLPQWAESGGGASAYNIFNGITRYVDHTVGERKEDRFEYAMLKGGNDLKEQGALVVANVFDVPLLVN